MVKALASFISTVVLNMPVAHLHFVFFVFSTLKLSLVQYNWSDTGQTTALCILVVAAAVVVTFSDTIAIVVIAVLGQVHDAFCVEARVAEPDSSQVTASTMADSRKSRSSSSIGPIGSRNKRLQCTNIR
jgi:hypothetical protein